MFYQLIQFFIGFTCWECGFESRRGNGCLSLMIVVLSGRGLCVGLITRPEEFYPVCCVPEYNRKSSIMRGPRSTGGLLRHGGCEINPLNPELNPICYLLALLGAHHFLHVSRTRVKSLTFRRLMSYIYIYIYIYGAPILDVSRSHTTTQHSR